MANPYPVTYTVKEYDDAARGRRELHTATVTTGGVLEYASIKFDGVGVSRVIALQHLVQTMARQIDHLQGELKQAAGEIRLDG